MNKVSIQYLVTPFGQMILGSFGDHLCMCDWKYRKTRTSIDRRILEGLDAGFEQEETGTIRLAIHQLNEYFSGKRTVFDLPLLPVGTPFQKRVWEELLRIPFGKTETYLGLAVRIGKEKSVRAVAAANGANAISIFIPCHRVVGRNGELTGYAGGKDVKRKLLQLETPGPWRLDLS
jgi:methylated-DNA-[protein]-cysteine S-methyltransferase